MWELFNISNDIYRTSEWLKDFTESIIIRVEKKYGVQECVEFKTMSLVSRASEIMLKILTARLENKAEICMVLEEVKVLDIEKIALQLGSAVRQKPEFDRKVFVCCVDYEKAFDRVN